MTLIRHLKRAKETERAVVFEEIPAQGATFNLFGPGGKVYISKEYAKDTQNIVVKIEFEEEQK